MTSVHEERDMPASPEAIWRVVADTTRWPDFYATPSEMGHLRAVEFLEGARADGPGVARRMHFLGLPAWDERLARWSPPELLVWEGIRNPGMRRWSQHLETIPGRGFTTLRWEVHFEAAAPRALGRAFRRELEELVHASLARVERLALAESAEPRA